MHISCSMTCACRTALDVHVKQLCIPSADIFLPDLINEYRRVMVKSTIDCFLLPSSFSLLPFSVTIVSFHCHYCLTLIYDMFLIVSEIIVILCFC
jgi:hypothetical protein